MAMTSPVTTLETGMRSPDRLSLDPSLRVGTASAGGALERLLLTPALRVDGRTTRPPLRSAKRTERSPSMLELRIAELERAVADQIGEWEPDGSEIERAAVASESAARPADAHMARTEHADSDLQIDEDVLRKVVAAMVRAEFQGELGERITRNVRKLVRREIRQALLAGRLDD